MGQDQAQNTTGVAVADGKDACGDCYGAGDEVGQCCNSCDDVIQAYTKKGWALLDYSKFEQVRAIGDMCARFSVSACQYSRLSREA